MMRTFDLSGPLFNGMWSYNSLPTMSTRLPEFTLSQVTSVAATGAEILHYDMSSLSGTYIETGAHMIEHTLLLSDLDTAALIRQAVVCHVPRKGACELIRRAELEAHCPPVRGGDALLIDCGWGSQWRSPSFVADGPSFHPDCLPWLLSQQMAILGVDVPCIQAWWAPSGSPESGEGMLLELFKAGVVLLAPLVNLDQIESVLGELIALPINAEGASGAPCRAVYREY